MNTYFSSLKPNSSRVSSVRNAAPAEREAQLRETLARAGVDALELATDDDLLESVQRFVQLRRQRTDPRRSAVQPGVAA